MNYVTFIKDNKSVLYGTHKIAVFLKGQWDVSFVIRFLVFLAVKFNIMLASVYGNM
jgi:hypothetical protein